MQREKNDTISKSDSLRDLNEAEYVDVFVYTLNVIVQNGTGSIALLDTISSEVFANYCVK